MEDPASAETNEAGIARRRARPSVRVYEHGDRAAVRRLCSATAAPFLPLTRDRGLAPRLYADSYLDLVPKTCFVATDAAGEIVGYAIGAADTTEFRRREVGYFRRRLPSSLVRWIGVLFSGRNGGWIGLRERARRTASILWGTYATQTLPDGVDLTRYPAHGHLQVAPHARDGRVGVALMRKLMAGLREAGACGQYGSVVEPVGEERYSRLALALGFREQHAEQFTQRDAPTLQDDRVWTRRILIRAYPEPRARR